MTCAKSKKGGIRSFAKPLAFALALLTIVISDSAFALPSATFVSPAPSENATTNTNWTYINLTSDEELNQSLLEWGNASGFTNVSIDNSSLVNWFFNMTNLADITYNYTIWMQNTTGNWSQSQRKWITVDTSSPYGLYACQNLTIANGNYVLMQNVFSAGTCFNILANNVVLDGNGSTINYSQSTTGYAISVSGATAATVNNLQIVQGNASVSGAYAIFFNNMSGGTLTNNTITTFGNTSHGLYLLASNTNTLSNNTVLVSGINSSAIALTSSASNTISGGAISSAQSFDYYLADSNFTNNFTNMNFTAQRSIYLNESYTGFVYSNNSVTLRTNISAQGNISRAIANWTNLLVKWNDTNSTLGVIAQYNISGLALSKVYYIFNTTGGARSNTTKLSDSGGNLNFTIALNGNTEISVDGPPIITITSPLNDTLNYSTQLDWVSANLTLIDPAASCWYSNITNASYNNITMNTTDSINWGAIISMPTGNTTYNTTFYCNDTNGNLGSTSRISFSRDDAPPIISSVSSGTPTTSSVVISWTVNERANCTVNYWDPNSSVSSNLTYYTSSCSQEIRDLPTANKKYYYTVTSCDRAGNCYTSPTTYDFRTAAAESTSTEDTTSSSEEDQVVIPNPLSRTWSSISAGTTVLMTISSTTVDMTKITVKIASAVTNAKITLVKLSAKPSSVSAEPSSKVYQYIDVNTENLPDSKISAATIFFRVTRTWLSQNNLSSSDVILYRYSGGKWIALGTYPTSDSTTKYLTYSADTAGFSHFAIGSSPTLLASQSTSNPQDGNLTQNISASNVTSALNNTTSIEDASSKSSKIFIYFILIVVVAILSALVYYGKPQFGSSKSGGYNFKSSGGSGTVVYKPQQKKEKFRYEYKKN